jgi:hypothetical protein
LLLFHPNTSAYHPTIYGSYGYHLNSIHSVSAYEDFCVWVRDGSIAHSEALGRIRKTLYLDNPSEDWDGLANNHVYFWPWYDPCPSYPSHQRILIELEYWVESGGCDGVSCAWKYGDPMQASGHYDYPYYYVLFKTTHLSGSVALYHHVVNHETGHVLGLADGNGTCPDSVMHSRYYACSIDREWPSFYDRYSVETLVYNCPWVGCP